jgi:SWI/SNF-related matrix-associated actin-dependent regulator 1 of chromatin subfamily A
MYRQIDGERNKAMPFIKEKCATCGRVAETEKEHVIGDKFVSLLKCGHVLIKDKLASKGSPEDIVSVDGKSLYKYQCDGVRFLEAANGRGLIADEMGLGKTWQAAGFLLLHPEVMPAAFVVKASLKHQWQYELMRIMGENFFVQIIESANDYILPKMPGYIFTFDVLRRFKDLPAKLDQLGVKTIVIDEVQQIKNVESQRTREVRAICKGRDHVIALSGTPIKNNASEYFPILNILKPEMFNNYHRFVWNECDTYNDGYKNKTAGLRYPKEFKAKTEHFIIRRERKEVLPDLPMITRAFHFSDLEASVERDYEAMYNLFELEMAKEDQSSFEKSSNVLAYLSKMRHITGRSKVNPTVEFVADFLEQTDRKITLFVHHKDVGEMLQKRVAEAAYVDEYGNVKSPKVLVLTADLSTDERAAVVDKFMLDASHRVLIASTLAAGEGLNLQKCSDCVMVERQWNPANEEQAEGRFIRIGQMSDKVVANYMVAIGTVDEFFSELVERKREIVTKTLGGEAVQWDQSSLMKELAENLLNRGKRKWSR